MKKIILDYQGANQLTVHDSTVIGSFIVGDTEISGLELPDISQVSFKKTQRDGSFLSSNFYEGRTISWTQVVVGATATAYIANRLLVLDALNIGRDSTGKATLKKAYFMDDDNAEYVIDYVVGQSRLPKTYLAYGTGSIVLFCPDPALLAATASSGTMTLAAGGGFDIGATGFDIGVTGFAIGTALGGGVSVNNAGNMEAWPIITINGPATNPTITNLTTGKSLSLSAVGLGSGETIIIDMAAPTITKGTQNYFQYKTVASEFWSLVPGTNSLAYTDTVYDERSSISVAYHSAYAGI